MTREELTRELKIQYEVDELVRKVGIKWLKK